MRDPKSKAFVTLPDGTDGFVEPSVPRALETGEVGHVVQDFAAAARHAEAAGFDGIEIHAANGYLFEQFLNPLLNDRTDRYGGTLENRARLVLETVDALVDVLGPGRVGIRLAPFNRQFDMPPYDAAETYLYLARELAKRPLAYVHLNDNWALGASVITEDFLAAFRAAYPGTLILAGAMTKERAVALVGKGLIDVPAFGQPFIANPDLVARLEHGYRSRPQIAPRTMAAAQRVTPIIPRTLRGRGLNLSQTGGTRHDQPTLPGHGPHRNHHPRHRGGDPLSHGSLRCRGDL